MAETVERDEAWFCSAGGVICADRVAVDASGSAGAGGTGWRLLLSGEVRKALVGLAVVSKGAAGVLSLGKAVVPAASAAASKRDGRRGRTASAGAVERATSWLRKSFTSGSIRDTPAGVGE